MATATKALQTASPPKTHNPVEASNNLLMPQEQPDTRPNTNKLGKDDLDPIEYPPFGRSAGRPRSAP